MKTANARPNQATARAINDGIPQTQRTKIASRLGAFLAGTYTLYLKAQNFHWNVEGPFFGSLHALFEKEYEQLAAATDVIAERIRALGGIAPATFKQFLELSAVKEEVLPADAMEMVRSLLTGYEILTREARSIASEAEEAEDQVTVDLMSERMAEQEKSAWMLRSHLS